MGFLRPLRVAFFIAFAAFAAGASAHDFERTSVVLTFARDGSFILDVTNDAAWLEHRLIPFERGDPEKVALHVFADRVVLFVDGREVRPSSVERVPAAAPLATYRLRGRVARDARTLRWYYGLPIDPYPLTVRRADGRILAEEIGGDAWSGPIDLSGEFAAQRVSATLAAAAIGALLIVPLALRSLSLRR